MSDLFADGVDCSVLAWPRLCPNWYEGNSKGSDGERIGKKRKEAITRFTCWFEGTGTELLASPVLGPGSGVCAEFRLSVVGERERGL